MTTGIIALSFTKRAHEPGPVNRRLAHITDEVTHSLESTGEPAVVVAQSEIARALLRKPDAVVTEDDATKRDRYGHLYLDSDDVLTEAFIRFRSADITDVIIVAQPFLHLQLAQVMTKRAGFTVEYMSIPPVGFDTHADNLQWWTKGPLRFVAYLLIQAIGTVLRKNFHGIGERH